MKLPPAGQYGVAMCFLPRDFVARHECEQTLERICKENNLAVLGWRDVPTNSEAANLGVTPRGVEPKIRQLFVTPGEHFFNRADFDRRLYLVRQARKTWLNLPPAIRRSRAIPSTSVCCRPPASSTRAC